MNRSRKLLQQGLVHFRPELARALLVATMVLLVIPYCSADAADFSAADATEITVKQAYKLESQGSAVFDYVRYSPDGHLVLYVKHEEGIVQQRKPVIVIRDVNTRKIVETFAGGLSAAWSPDGKKILYCMPGHGLWIYDRATQRSLNLTFPQAAGSNALGCENGFRWVKPNLVYAYYEGFGSAIDLDQLRITRLDREGEIKTHVDVDAFQNHQRCRIYENAVELPEQNWELAVVVENKDNSFGRTLVRSVTTGFPVKANYRYMYMAFDASPDLSSVVYTARDGIYIAYLGIRKKPPTTFQLDLDIGNVLRNIPDIQYLRNYTYPNFLQNAKSAGGAWGAVFSPLKNPLNGKIVGPDPKGFKGYVRFTNVGEQTSDVRVAYEHSSPIVAGDIVTDIHSGDVNLQRAWTPLRSWSSAHESVSAPASKEETSIESNRQGASGGALADSAGGAVSELSQFLSLPIASKAEYEKFGEAERQRAQQAEGPANRVRVDSLRQQAGAAARWGRWPQVIEAYNQILAIDPEDWYAYLMLCASYNGLKQPDQTLNYAAKALKRFRYSALYAIVAVAYGQKGDKEKFLSWLEKAVDAGSPLNPRSLDQSFPQYRDDPRYKAIMQKYQTASR